MSNNERDNLTELLKGYQALQSEQHREFKEALKEINMKLDPVYDVYSTFKGFGSITGGFFKWVIIPCSIVLGIIISIKKIWLE